MRSKFMISPLSDAEIQNEYNLSHSGMVLFLPFNGNAYDESGNNNNGTVNGASLTQDRFGINGRAYQFDGIDDFVSIADNPNLFSDELTISWWYKMTEILGGERVVIGWVDGGHRYQQFFNGGQLSYLNGYNVGQPGMYFNPIYGLNELSIWKNIVVTYEKLMKQLQQLQFMLMGS
ncbi:MAG: LamG domain-containing protein [Ignavibacteriales bacterium]|nr:LamG domain-containing protein [Ignavibacteriales bacterium]